MCWAGDIALEEVLAAADRRSRRGQDLPAWGEPERPAKGGSSHLTRSRPGGDARAVDPHREDRPSGSGSPAGGPPGRLHPAASGPATQDPTAKNPATQNPATQDPTAKNPATQDPADEDPLAEDELRAAETAVGEPMPSPEMAGHVRMPPGPALAAWLGQAEPGQLDEAGLVNSITGWRKLTSWAQAQELAAVAELGRRRGVMDDPELDRDPVRELSAEFAPNEVALALTLTQYAAQWWMSLAVNTSRRLPGTWSALSQGTIDLGRAKLIDLWTTPLDDDLAGAVERKVLVRAGQQTTGQLRASLQRAVISVDPAAAERRRTEAEKNARVELTGEDSGTAALSGHFLPAAQASAAWARISGMAAAMKGDGAGGGIDLLRAQVFVGLLLGTLPQPPDEVPPGNSDPPGAPPDDGGTSRGDGNTPPRDGGPDAPGDAAGQERGSGPHDEPAPEVPPSGNARDDHPPHGPANGDPGQGPRPAAADDQPWCWPPIPAPGEVPWPDGGTGTVKIRRPELTVSWRTLAGWWDEPGQLTRMGAITAAVARELAQAASADPTCLWRVVVTDAEGQVMAVTRSRWPGRPQRKSDHPPGPGVLGRITVTVPVMLLGEPPPATQGCLNACPELAAALRAILVAAAATAREAGRADGDHADGDHEGGDHEVPCIHANAASGYRIPAWMRDLIEVRDQDCGFPICRRPASSCDLDHTVPYDQGGLTCPCNVSGGCRHDHRMKGSTAWRLEQPRPGTLIWTAPSGLSWTVTPQPHVT
ncbi:MAG: endonuclease [Actinomycetia bacterium]|nr:endonuclease [Actinomycetes bacterium]